MSALEHTARRPRPSVLFSASRRVGILEHFRVPYHIADSRLNPEIEYLRLNGHGPALIWPREPARYGPRVGATLLRANGSRIPIFANIADDRLAASLLAQHGGNWSPGSVVSTAGGQHVASVWRSDDGSLFLPFDPDEVRLNFLSERYKEILEHPTARALRDLALRAYYRSRRLMPRTLQIRLRRRYVPLQVRAQFPSWPIETALHDFLETFFAMLQSIADQPVPRIGAWPSGSSWALVLTHDVETAAGLQAVDPVLEIERNLGLRSSWNFVPRRYDLSAQRVRALASEGFEVGVHGLYHDGRDLESPAVLRQRLPGMREAAVRWNAVGFRSPATRRNWGLMPLLGFDYDSSYPDTDPFEPQAGGCCTWLPFFNQEMVELPITMAQDHTLFTILRQPDELAWVQKAEFLRSCGGMVLLDTHPDYLAEEKLLAAYGRFLTRFAGDDDAWKALPGEVSSWWRRRARSRLEGVGGAWRVTGEAANEASVEFAPADAHSFDLLWGETGHGSVMY